MEKQSNVKTPNGKSSRSAKPGDAARTQTHEKKNEKEKSALNREKKEREEKEKEHEKEKMIVQPDGKVASGTSTPIVNEDAQKKIVNNPSGTDSSEPAESEAQG
jgi:hypothetical protein